MSCKRCEHWDPFTDNPDAPPRGLCRRFPPVPTPSVGYNLMGKSQGQPGASDLVWRQPTTDATDWCGEQKDREEPT